MPSSPSLSSHPIRSNTDPIASPRTATPALNSSARSSLSDLPQASYDLSIDYGPQDDEQGGGDESFSSTNTNTNNKNRRGSLLSAGGGGGGAAPSRTGRTRARALSIAFNSPHSGRRNGDDAEGEAFDDEAYSYALRPDEEDEDEDQDDRDEIDGLEMTRLSTSGGLQRENHVSNKGREYHRSHFQPLTGHEMSWIGLTAFVVITLSAAAVVLAAIG